MTYHIPALIPATYLLASIIIPLLGYWRRSLSFYPALAGGLLTVFFSAWGLHAVITEGAISYHLGGWVPPVGIELMLDPLSAFISLIITSMALLTLFYAYRNVQQELPDKVMPFYSLAMLFMAGLSGMAITGDFFNLFVFLEISALAGYALLGLGHKRAPFSSFRYLILGTAGASFYLLGVGIIYIATGTLNMIDVSQVLPYVDDMRPMVVGMILIIMGVVIKMGIFPIHQWLPGAYTHSASTATVLIAPIGTKVAAYILIRALTIFDFPPLLDALSWIAALSILAGSILAISQTNIKSILAYSSVANIGYIALGATLANPLAFIGAMFHILNHALMKLVMFMSAGGMLNNMGSLDIGRLRGFPQVMPWTALAFFVAALSMVGIPPTGGFFSKLYLILGAIEAEAWIFVLVIMVSTLLALVYLFRFMNLAFFRRYESVDDHLITQEEGRVLGFDRITRDEAPKEYEHMPRKEMRFGMLLPVLLVTAAIILVGIYNGFIIDNAIELTIPNQYQN